MRRISESLAATSELAIGNQSTSLLGARNRHKRTLRDCVSALKATCPSKNQAHPFPSGCILTGRRVDRSVPARPAYIPPEAWARAESKARKNPSQYHRAHQRPLLSISERLSPLCRPP
jgi:hypothetical protein